MTGSGRWVQRFDKVIFANGNDDYWEFLCFLTARVCSDDYLVKQNESLFVHERFIYSYVV